MAEPNHLTKHSAKLQFQTDIPSGTILARHRDTPLRDVMNCLESHHYVVVTEERGRVAGLVAAQNVRSRLSTTNPYELARWQQMPVSSLLNVTFSPRDGDAPVLTSKHLECVAVAEGEKLFGIAIDDDVFLSWRRLESLLSMALSDPLTGLLNRLSYERRLCEEWNRRTCTGMSVGVVVIDLDRFKQVNDTYGHPAGDEILRRVAAQLESSMRSYDLVARFGGDEFVALCLGCAHGDISIPVARIQQGIAAMNPDYEGQSIPVTASIGAAVRHDGFADSDPRELFSAADECLYHAKASAESAWKVEFGSENTGIPEPIKFDSPTDSLEVLASTAATSSVSMGDCHE